MSHSYDLQRVVDLVGASERQLELVIGLEADRPGVRHVLEQLSIKSWQRGRRSAELAGDAPADSEGVRVDSDDVTPLHSPRVAREVQATRPMKHSPPRPIKPVKGQVQGDWNRDRKDRKP